MTTEDTGTARPAQGTAETEEFDALLPCAPPDLTGDRLVVIGRQPARLDVRPDPQSPHRLVVVEVAASGFDSGFDSHDPFPFYVVVVDRQLMAVVTAHRMNPDDASTVGAGEPSA